MYRLLSSLLILLTVSFVGFSQNDYSRCSALRVTGPPAIVGPGESQFFEAKLVPEIDPSKFQIKWTVINGKILSGQGTMRIEVSSVPRGEAVAATADVFGLGKCDVSGSDTAVTCDCLEPALIDEFGILPDDELQLRIENLFLSLETEPTSTSYIVNYGKAGFVRKREEQIRSLLPRAFQEHPSLRLVFVNGGPDQNKETVIRTQFWLVPAGADTSVINE